MAHRAPGVLGLLWCRTSTCFSHPVARPCGYSGPSSRTAHQAAWGKTVGQRSIYCVWTRRWPPLAGSPAHGLYVLTQYWANSGSTGWVSRCGLQKLLLRLLWPQPLRTHSPPTSRAVFLHSGAMIVLRSAEASVTVACPSERSRIGLPKPIGATTRARTGARCTLPWPTPWCSTRG